METQKMSAFLRELRKERGLTQEQAAEELFVSSKTLSRWETGATIPDLETLMKLAEYYKVDIKELIDGERREPDEDPAVQQQSSLQAVAEYGSQREKRSVKQAVLRVLIVFLVLAGIYAFFRIREVVRELNEERGGFATGKIVEYFPKEEDGSQKLRIDRDFEQIIIRVMPDARIGDDVKPRLDAQEEGVFVRIWISYTKRDIHRAEKKGETFVYPAYMVFTWKNVY
ncbi:MAG: helix-turn-helix domain-containing protein [Lachnospiraceae bacterium]|nr:helix-turn-helix domain-containing protein [Lachnospiraceae bacterium]